MRTYRAEQAQGPGGHDILIQRDLGDKRERAEIIARMWTHAAPTWSTHVAALEDGCEVGRMAIGGAADGQISGTYP